MAGRRGQGRRIGYWLLASLLLHGLLASYFVARPRDIQDLPPPSVEVVFEGGQPLRPLAEPPPGVAETSPPPVRESAPPAPQPQPTTASPPAVEPQPPAAPPEPPPDPLPDLAAEPLPAPPPPPPLPAAPPRQPARPPALPAGVIWAPGGVSLGAPVPPRAAAGRPSARGLDLSIDPRMLEGQASADPNLRVTGAQVGADWRAAFRRWLDQNIGYPLGALRNGESGTVRVQVVAGPDGRVRSVRLTGASGSPSLNFGTTFPFSGAQLPAFPPPADPAVTIDLTVNYILIRR